MSIDRDVKPPRRRAFRIRTLMAAVVVVAMVLGWDAWLNRSFRRISAAEGWMNEWINQLQANNPTLVQTGATARMDGDFFGHETIIQVEYKTPAGRPIAITGTACSRPFGPESVVVIECDGRSIVRPMADIERRRGIDLKAEFPGAFVPR